MTEAVTITQEKIAELQAIARKLMPHEKVSLTGGKIIISGEPKNRAERKRLNALKRRYED